MSRYPPLYLLTIFATPNAIANSYAKFQYNDSVSAVRAEQLTSAGRIK